MVPLLNTFAEKWVNGEFPNWFYTTFTAVKLVAPVKEPATGLSAVPDVRPVGIGESLRRAINAALLRDMREECVAHLWPQQVAVGVAGGSNLLINGIRLLLEAHPDWTAVRLDLRNAYNEIARAHVLRALDHS